MTLNENIMINNGDDKEGNAKGKGPRITGWVQVSLARAPLSV